LEDFNVSNVVQMPKKPVGTKKIHTTTFIACDCVGNPSPFLVIMNGKKIERLLCVACEKEVPVSNGEINCQ